MTAKNTRPPVELPFHKPMFATYHYLAGAGIVAKGNPTSDNWYFNQAIPIVCQTEFSIKGSPCIRLAGACNNIWQLPFIEKVGFQTRFTKSCSREIIQSMLEQGFYVMFDGVDDYYVKGKSWYKERHFNHDGMILGINNAEGTYTLAAYDQRWIYRPFQTTQRSFSNGLKAIGNGNLVAVKCGNRDPVLLDIPHIHQELTQYLTSEPNPSGKDTFGVSVYPVLYTYFARLKSGQTPHEKIDRRILRLIWEHKRCMALRIAAVESHCGLTGELSTAYDPLVELANTIRLMYAKYVLSPEDSLMDSLTDKLRELVEREGLILQKLIPQIA